VGNAIEIVKVAFVFSARFQVSSGRQDNFVLCISNDSHQTVIDMVGACPAAPIGCWEILVAYDRTGLADELHCLEKSTLCEVKGTILVISRSKANRVSV